MSPTNPTNPTWTTRLTDLLGPRFLAAAAAPRRIRPRRRTRIRPRLLGVSLRRATTVLQQLVAEGALAHVEKRGDSEPAYRLPEGA